MKNLYKTRDEEISYSVRHIRDTLKKRGWPKAEVILSKTAFIMATRPDGKVIKIKSTVPPTTSCFSSIVADDKFATYQMLEDINIPQPKTVMLENVDTEAIKEMLKKYKKIVVKPLDGAHGNNVTTGITTTKEAVECVEKIKPGKSLVQEQIEITENEIRIICIGYKFVAAFERIPAAVTGDGKHTISELIKIENKTCRTEAYKSNLAYINLDEAMHYLGEKINNVPKKNEKVRVVSACNVGRGGTVKDVSSKISAKQRKEAEKIAKHLELPVVGIDYFGDKVLEVNCSPSLYYPTGDDSSNFCVEKLIEYLEEI